MIKYCAGAKFEKGGREHFTNPTESMIEVAMSAKAYHDKGCLDTTFYIIDEQGEQEGLSYSQIESLVNF